MTTTTLILKRYSHTIGHSIHSIGEFATSHKTRYGVAGGVLALLFITYLALPAVGLLDSSSLLLTFLFIVIVPVVAFVLAILSLRRNQDPDNIEIVSSYFALGITSLYFMTALAVPLVLVASYLLYAYVL